MLFTIYEHTSQNDEKYKVMVYLSRYGFGANYSLLYKYEIYDSYNQLVDRSNYEFSTMESLKNIVFESVECHEYWSWYRANSSHME